MRNHKKMALILFPAGVLLVWQLLYMLQVFPEILFPSVPGIVNALVSGIGTQQMGEAVWYTLKQISKGLFIGISLAVILSVCSILSPIFRNYCNILIACFDPLPGIALLPLAILWFGIGEGAVLFTIVHSVLWPLSENIMKGFLAADPVHVESGKNIGLQHIHLVMGVYLPSSAPHLISGLKTCWGRSWRAVISAEMIFGATNAAGGVGWYLFKRRYMMDTAGVYAVLVVIIMIGIAVEYGLFALVETHTIKKWGMIKS